MWKIPGKYAVDLTIDETTVTIQVARLTLEQSVYIQNEIKAIQHRSRRSAAQRTKLLLAVDTPQSPEEMTAAQSAYEALELRIVADETKSQNFLSDIITKYISLDAGQVEGPSGSAVTTGQELVDLVCGRRDVFQMLVNAVMDANRLSVPEKKASPSPSGSGNGSADKIDGPRGDAPEPTAAPASQSDSASSAAATATSPVLPSSGKAEA